MKKENTRRGRHLSRKALESFIHAGRKRPALYALIAEEMERQDRKASGAKYWRQEVAGWLHDDETKRVEPRLGVALLLLNAAAIVCKRESKKEAA